MRPPTRKSALPIWAPSITSGNIRASARTSSGPIGAGSARAAGRRLPGDARMLADVARFRAGILVRHPLAGLDDRLDGIVGILRLDEQPGLPFGSRPHGDEGPGPLGRGTWGEERRRHPAFPNVGGPK